MQGTKNKLFFLFIFLFVFISFAYGENIKMIIDGTSYNPPKGAVFKNGLVFVPARVVADKMKIAFYYEASTNRVKLIGKENSVIFFLGENEMSVNGSKAFLMAAPILENDRIYVPVNIFERYFGSAASYDAKKKIIRIFSDRRLPAKKTNKKKIEENLDIGDIDDSYDIDDF